MAGRKQPWFVALFFIALLALGLLTSADYGQPWDEPWEQDILRMNGNQYAAALGIDARLALTSTMQGPESGLIADSIERDHGQCAYYPMLWMMGNQTLTGVQQMFLWHAYTWLWFVAGAAALWLIARRLGLSRLLSSAAALLLVLTPRMFAEGHYNNKDIVLLSLALLTLWLALRLMEKPGVGRAVLFSLAGALAANTKIIGLAIWGLCALVALIRQIWGRRMNGRVWLAMLVTLVSFAGFYTLFTPALWPDPRGYLTYVIQNATGFTRWDNNVLFRGAIYQLANTALPRYYLPYMILATTPLWILALLVIGQGYAVIRMVRPGREARDPDTCLALWLCTLLWLLPLGYAVVARATVYNGWRHFYFIYGPMLALAAYGLGRMRHWLGALHARAPRRVGAALLALCMAMTGTLITLAHPNEYTFYNSLLQNRDLPEYLELDYWNVSVLQTLRTLLDSEGVKERATVTGAELWSQIGLEANWKLLTPEQQSRLKVLPQGDISADYVLSNRTYAVLGHWHAEPSMQAVVTTKAYGLPLCTVYTQTAP